MSETNLHQGSKFKIIFAKRTGGSIPARDYFFRLDKRYKARFHLLFEKMANTGRINNNEHFRKIKDTELFEFKRAQFRFFCFFTEEKEVVLTHGFKKKQQKTPKKEIEKALKIKKEYISVLKGKR